MCYTGKVRNGVVVLDNGADLAEGTVVRVEPMQRLRQHKPRSRKATVRKGLLALAGKARGLPADAARNVDHYLYGHPRK